MSLALVSLAGLLLFVWPFLGGGQLDALSAVGVTLAAVAALALVEAGTRRLDAGRLALLAAIAAINTTLRLALVTGIAGFSPMFLLIITAGYAFGPSYGFLVGAFSILVSGIATGGVGPWLPYEMFAAGWVGVAAGIAAGAVGSMPRRGRPEAGVVGGLASWASSRRDLVALLAVGVVTGFAYGFMTDVWDWSTYWKGAEGLGWLPGAPLAENVGQFLRFYTVTSFGWDLVRAIGNAVALLAFGMPVLMGLRRLRARLGFERVAAPEASEWSSFAAG